MNYADELRNKHIKRIIETQGRENIIKLTTEFWRTISVSEKAPYGLVDIALDKITELRNEEISDFDLFYILDDMNTIVNNKYDYQQMYDYLTRYEDLSSLDVADYYCPQEVDEELEKMK